MITTGERDVRVEAPVRLVAARRALGALWGARGWWGGLIACGLAALGQDALIARGDPAGAGRYYLAAIVLLIAAFLHPAWPWHRRPTVSPPAAGEVLPLATPAPLAATNGVAPSIAETVADSSPARVTPWLPGGAVLPVRERVRPAVPPARTDVAPVGGTLPVRRAARGPAPPAGAALTAPPSAAAPPAAHANGHAAEPLPAAQPARAQARAQGSLWTRRQAVRARWGWRVTVPGLLLTLGLAGAATALLLRDIADPRGGWLWAAALAVLILTFVGAPGWPRGAGLLPGPEHDFFATGLPRPAVRWEAVGAIVILGVALALRLVNLETAPGVFGDEGERGMDARGIVDGQPALLFGYGWWGVPNLYFYLVSWMLRLFGDHNMVADRMLSVISGMLAVWFVYRIGRLLWGPRAGLIAGALLAVSPLALQFSRLAGESTPTGALWAGGFFFLFRALRFRRPLDWVLSGILCGFSLYFYAAGKLIIPLLAAAGLYCLLRWHVAFLKRYLLGFVLLGLAFGLTFLPYALFSIADHWQGFMGRAGETSIFSPQNQAPAFAHYGLPYDPAWAGQPLVQNVLAHPLAWARLAFEQMRVTAEVIYRSGDPTPFYQIQVHGGSMLPPLWAALALLALAYGAWKLWDGRFGLISIWFWGGMLGAALTMDTPSVQRLTGAWPVIMLFPAVLIDRVAAGAWPLNLSLARRWMNVPVAALLIFFGADGYNEYFGHYLSLCPYCTSTVQARWSAALGQDYKAYQFGVGGYDIFFTYGPTRYLAKGVAGSDMSIPANYFPATDNKGKGAAYLVYAPNADYLPLIRLFYPGGAAEVAKGSNGAPQFTGYKVSAAQMATFQALHASYTPPGGSPITRVEPNLGTGRVAGAPAGAWTPPAGLTYPAPATWQGGLVAPAYGLYTFQIAGGNDGQLQVDGRPVLDEHAAAGSKLPAPQQIDFVLAKGLHDVRLSGTLANAAARLTVTWGAQGSAPVAVAANYLYAGPTGGLSGEIWWGSAAPLDSPDLSGGKPADYRRSDPFFGFREAHDDAASFGQGAFVARWQGTLTAPAAGTYGFATHSNGTSLLLIDGKPVVTNPANGNEGAANGAVDLTAGPHVIEVRYSWQSGRATLEVYWTPPGATAALIPPTALAPAARSWPRGAVPDPASAAGTDVTPPPPPAAIVTPDAVLGADAGLKEPRGIGVDAQGNMYVGDSGNHRIVRLDPRGHVLGTWGSATDTSAPGKFGVIGDVAVAPDGHVATLDVTTGDVQVFASDGRLTLQIPHASPNSSGIALGPDGRIWVASTSNSVVLRFTAAGQLDGTFMGGAAGSPLHFEQPIDVAVAPDGTAYVVDLRGRIMRLDAQGQVATQWAVEWGGARGGSHLTLWRGLLVMTDPDRQRLTVLDPATGAIHEVGTPGTQPGQFRLPIGIAAGADGKVYVVDSDNARVQVFSTLDAK